MEGKIKLVRLSNESGMSVLLSNLGAGILEVMFPDRNGKIDDICLGYKNPTDYINDGAMTGRIPGRYSNRIAKGNLTIEGRNYQLEINCGPNALHGGPNGFHNQFWKIESADNNTVVFSYFSKDGEGNYPGNLNVKVTYHLTDDNELQIILEADTDALTVINLTNHSYWNLNGHNSGSVLSHHLQLAASKYIPTDETLVPTGDFNDVKDTPMDFTSSKTIGRDIKNDFPALKFGKGYDNCWAIDDFCAGEIKKVAELLSEESGRKLTISSDQPAVQVYTGNWLAGTPTNKSGHAYRDYDGVAIECQDFPDAPNHPNFVSTMLRPGQHYLRHIYFKLSTF